MWKFALVLAVVHCASCVTPSTYWVLETLKCSKHRVMMVPHRNLAETPEALDQMCDRQDEFYRCLDKLVSLMEPASVSEVSSETETERSVFKGLCSHDSPWRKMYLETASCINIQQTDFCKTPEFLGGGGTELISPCTCRSVAENVINCIGVTLWNKCGFEAIRVFYYILQLKNYDFFKPMEMTYTDADPSSKGKHSTENVFGGIYDQFVNKIGYVPEQDSEGSFVLHKRVGRMHEESESVDENISSSVEIEDSDPYSHIVEIEDYYGNVKHGVFEDDEDPDIFSILDKFGLQFDDVLKRREDLMAKGPLAVSSIIKDRIRRSSTFKLEENYETVRIFPDGRINYYSRRRDIQDLKTIKCYNFQDYFVCKNMPRSKYPRCLKTTVFTGPRKDKFFPEEFDPEFGAQWYETKPNEAYLFGPWVYQSIGDASKLSIKSASGTEDSQVSDVPVDNGGSEDETEQLEDVDTDTRFVSKDSSFIIMKDSDAYEFKRNKEEIIMHLFKHFTAALPSASKIDIKNLIPENIAEALTYLHESKGQSFENVKIRRGNSGNLYIFWNNHKSVIDAITCGKVNECHPKGEDIWKCVIEPRPRIRTDDLNI